MLAPRFFCGAVFMVLQYSIATAFLVPVEAPLKHQLRGDSCPISRYDGIFRSTRRSNVIVVLGASPAQKEGRVANDGESNQKDVSVRSELGEKIAVTNTTAGSNNASKFRQLKELMWVRDTLEDVTAAEFACAVETTSHSDGNKKRAVDYEKLASQLDRRLRDLTGCEIEVVREPDFELSIEYGMGRIVYSHSQRRVLFEKILEIRNALSEATKSYKLQGKNKDENPFELSLPDVSAVRSGLNNASLPSTNRPYIREDGRVEFEGALQGSAAVSILGKNVWARINGKDPNLLSDYDSEGNSTDAVGTHSTDLVISKVEETPAIKQAREKLSDLKAELAEMEKAHTALISSGIPAGQPVANVNLASLDPSLRNQIRESDEALRMKRQTVSFQMLDYELERIFTYLAEDVGPRTKGYVPLQDRLNVAEFGLLESQIESFHKELAAGDAIDADILAVVSEQLSDFKRRLAIDYNVAEVKLFDAERIQTLRPWFKETLQNMKKGLGFYSRGCRLFWSDIVYCTSLLVRAIKGYTLKPREVCTIRRTFKDMINFIPFIIILIIPISPVGHVVVFGAIQKYYPGFFPSSFTEERQNLLQLYESTEYSELTIDENLKEKLARFFKAVSFFVASRFRSLYQKMTKKGTEQIKTRNDDGTENDSKPNGSR